MSGKLISRNEAFGTDLDPTAQALLLELSMYDSIHRRGIGNSVDELSVMQARDAVASIDKELERVQKLRGALVVLQSEITGSVK